MTLLLFPISVSHFFFQSNFCFIWVLLLFVSRCRALLINWHTFKMYELKSSLIWMNTRMRPSLCQVMKLPTGPRAPPVLSHLLLHCLPSSLSNDDGLLSFTLHRCAFLIDIIHIDRENHPVYTPSLFSVFRC